MGFEENNRDRLERVCARKRHYHSKRVAIAKAAKLRKKYGHAIFAYKCPICGEWLHSSQPKTQADVNRAMNGQRAPLAPKVLAINEQ